MVLMKVPADSMLGKYSELMPYLCAKEGMKPVCNDPAACKSDPASLYIGQTGKLTSAAGRSAKGGAPKGLANASKHFAATCGYSGKGKPVVCEGIKGGVSTPPASNPGFVCGRKGPSQPRSLLSSNITRECPSSLLTLQGNPLPPFLYDTSCPTSKEGMSSSLFRVSVCASFHSQCHRSIPSHAIAAARALKSSLLGHARRKAA